MYCSKCGMELPEGVNFCSRCGNKVGEVSVKQSISRRKMRSSISGAGILSVVILIIIFIIMVTMY